MLKKVLQNLLTPCTSEHFKIVNNNTQKPSTILIKTKLSIYKIKKSEKSRKVKLKKSLIEVPEIQ